MRWRRFELAALDLRYQLGELGVARCRHAGLGAFARDEAVHLLDLGAPSLEDVLRHRRALDIGARVFARLRDQRALYGVERLPIAFGGARQLLGLQAADLLELVAERLADPHAFAGERDLEAPDALVAEARGRGETGRGGYAVAHAVLYQLRPALAPEIGGSLGAVDAAEPFDQLLDARGDAPVRLADAEHGVLLATLGDGAADSTRFVHVDRDERGDHADHAAPADDSRNRFLVQAVLQRDDEAARREIRRDQCSGPGGVVGLHRDEGDIDRRLGERLHLGEVQGLRLLHREALGGRHAVELQAARADGFDVLRPGIDQRHVMPELREIAADIAAQGTGADYCDAFGHGAHHRRKS